MSRDVIKRQICRLLLDPRFQVGAATFDDFGKRRRTGRGVGGLVSPGRNICNRNHKNGGIFYDIGAQFNHTRRQS
jgi:hypothetical protein